MTSRTGLLALFALLLASWPTAVTAQAPQSLSIVPVQDLAFGLLLFLGRVAITRRDWRRLAHYGLAAMVTIAVVLPWHVRDRTLDFTLRRTRAADPLDASPNVA